MRVATTLSRSASPHLDHRGDFLRELQESLSKAKRSRVRAPADLPALRELQRVLIEIASYDLGKYFGHVVPQTLKEDMDHLIGVHLMGYEHNESGRPDSDGDRWTWRTGVGTYSSDPLRPWSTDLESALFLCRLLCPDLRLQIRFGGPRNGQPVKCSFSKKHKTAALAGREIPLPAKWPKSVKDHPAIAVVWVLLEALALEKDPAGASEAQAA